MKKLALGLLLGTCLGQAAIGATPVTPTTKAGGAYDTGSGATTANTQRVALDSADSANIAGPVPACSASPCTTTIGRVGIDHSTPGTTDNVTVSANGATPVPIIQATASVPITFTAAGGPTQIIAASGSTKIYITHIHYVLSGVGTFALITGTGTNCGTGTTYLEGASGHPLSFAANSGISAGGGLGPIYITAAGGEICAIYTGSVDTSGVISYTQF